MLIMSKKEHFSRLIFYYLSVFILATCLRNKIQSMTPYYVCNLLLVDDENGY